MAVSVSILVESAPSPWVLLRVTGDLDVATGPDLDARLERVLAGHPDDGIVVDLSEVPFMDCAGLRPLLRARARLPGRFCLRAVRPPVLRLLDVAEVASSLRVLPDGVAWPAEADPQRCVALEAAMGDGFDHESDDHESPALRRSRPAARSVLATATARP